MELGAHTSTAGGTPRAPARGHEVGCDCIQIFTRNQRTWKTKPVTADEVDGFRAARADAGIGTVMSHASYLINLAAKDPDKHQKSTRALGEELERCHLLGIGLLNFHPGAHMERGLEAGIRTIAETLNAICRDHPDKTDVTLVLENVAGQGSTVGAGFDELAGILEHVEAPERFGVCIDTAHAFAAGYALHTEEGWEEMWSGFDRIIGLERLVGIHLNDSKAPFGSRKDRHALIGRGKIGAGAFQRMVTDPRTRDIPMFLETPAGPDGWKLELKWLRAAAAGEDLSLPEIAETGLAL